MQQYLKQDIQFLPGVGPKRADLLREELKIQTFEDLITYYPYKYIDRSTFYKISDITSEGYILFNVRPVNLGPLNPFLPGTYYRKADNGNIVLF